MFTNAIVRKPGINFASGLTSVNLGLPNYELALEQWTVYCAALESCGLTLTRLEPDLLYPDSTFVEDAAVLTPASAMLTRPGAESRLGEVEGISASVCLFYPEVSRIIEPGFLDGGDICEAADHFLLGISHRTNEDGARQLAAHLAAEGYTSSYIDVRAMNSILHLKSGISYIGSAEAKDSSETTGLGLAKTGENVLVVMEEIAGLEAFSGYELLTVSAEESYAANCVRVNDKVLVAAGFPKIIADLVAFGFDPLVLEMSEFQKMDGGLSCLSLRF